MKKTGTNGIIRFGSALLCAALCMGTASAMPASADSLKESGATGENIDRYIEFQLYERTSLTYDRELLDTQEVCIWGVGSGTISFDGLNENNSYFFRFYNSTGFSRYSKMNISGTITIDE